MIVTHETTYYQYRFQQLFLSYYLHEIQSYHVLEIKQAIAPSSLQKSELSSSFHKPIIPSQLRASIESHHLASPILSNH